MIARRWASSRMWATSARGPGVFARLGLLLALDRPLGFGFDTNKLAAIRATVGGKFRSLTRGSQRWPCSGSRRSPARLADHQEPDVDHLGEQRHPARAARAGAMPSASQS